jgi:phosphate transport system permease protein
MPATQAPPPARPPTGPESGPDRIFRGGVRVAAIATSSLMALIGLFLALRSVSAWRLAGWSFFSKTQWFPGANNFGVGALLLGTVMIASVALVIAFPIASAAALFIAEIAPPSVRRVLVSAVDLMAAVPSIVYGLWGFFFLQPHALGVSRFLSDHLGFVPFFHADRPVGGTPAGFFASSTFIAGVTVSLMVMPIACAVMREVFAQAPQGEREAAYALGATQWGVIRSVVLPFGRGGMIGGAMLGLGRALGETVAVLLIVSPLFAGPGRMIHVLQGGGNSIAANIANRYFEDSTGLGLAALMASGLVLFAMTFAVNSIASIVISRSRSGALTEI